MKKRKILSAALAAGLAFGSLSVVSYAGAPEPREESGYSITLENVTVDGEEMAAIVFEGLPAEALEIDGTIFEGEPHIHEKDLGMYGDHKLIWVSDFSNGSTALHINLGEIRIYRYSSDEIWNACTYDDERVDYQVAAEEQENGTITVTTYIDLDNKYLKSLVGKDEWTVSVCAEVWGSGESHLDLDDDGHISDNEMKGSLATGDAYEYVEIIPNKEIELHTLDDMYTAPTQTIKVTNNLTGVEPIVEKVFTDTAIEASEGIDDDVKTALSGITVTDSLGAFEDGVAMNITGTKQTESSFSFDITFTKDGTEVQPKEKVTVKVPIPNFLKGKTIKVTHYDKDGNKRTIYPTIRDGFVYFEADSFSVYELADENAPTTQPNKPQDTNTGSGSSSSGGSGSSSGSAEATASKTTNPDTGVSLAVAPVILAAGVAVVALGNKRRR